MKKIYPRQLRRKDITGFTFKALGLCIEFVFIYYIPRTVAIYHRDNIRLIKRFEI